MSKAPPAPPHLVEDGPGREAWARLWTAGAAWLSPKVDVQLMTRYSEALDERWAIWQTISTDGTTTRGSTGQIRLHPLFTRLAVVDASLLQMEKSLGFTPADRTRLGAVEAKPPTVLDQLMANAKARAADGA